MSGQDIASVLALALHSGRQHVDAFGLGDNYMEQANIFMQLSAVQAMDTEML